MQHGGLWLTSFGDLGGAILDSVLRPGAFLTVTAAVLAARLILALLSIPPWQGPDEHAHVAFAEVWRNRLVAPSTPDPGREEEILRSMAEHDWWRHYGRTPPAMLPNRFVLLTTLDYEVAYTIGIDPTLTRHPAAYHAPVGAVLALTPRTSVVADLYLMRVLSGACALLTLCVAWRAARETIGDRGAAGVAALLALHPQFVLVGATAGPDALVNLAGACVWWGAVHALRSPGALRPLVGMWLAAAAGAAADRLGLPLVAAAALASLVIIVRHPRRLRLLLVTAVIGAAAAVVAIAGWGLAARLPSATAGTAFPFAVEDRATTWTFFREFTALLFRSWWLVFGWLRYRAPDWWLMIPAVLSCAALLGLVRRVAARPRAPEDVVLALGAAMIALQVAAVYWTFFRLDVSAQGRYLFPLLVPTLVLFWLGLQALVPDRYQPAAAVGVVVTFAVLDGLAWLAVGIPAYAI